ncbi:MAG: hypothetical protein AAFR13_06850 [Pseudomonadota bacterium]
MRNAACATFLAFTSLAAVLSPALGDTVSTNALLSSWYSAHGNAFERDAARSAVAAMLSEDAAIELRDLDLVQTRDEYLESFDGWRDAIEGGAVAFRIDSIDGDTSTVTVCYRFASQPILNAETITLDSDGTIAAIVAEQTADTCDSF